MKTRHPNILDHSPAYLSEMATYAQELSHGFTEPDFDNLQNISNLLTDWASLKEGWILNPKPKT